MLSPLVSLKVITLSGFHYIWPFNVYFHHFEADILPFKVSCPYYHFVSSLFPLDWFKQLLVWQWFERQRQMFNQHNYSNCTSVDLFSLFCHLMKDITSHSYLLSLFLLIFLSSSFFSLPLSPPYSLSFFLSYTLHFCTITLFIYLFFLPLSLSPS